MIADPYPFISGLIKQYTSADSRLNIARTWSRGHHRNIRLARAGMSALFPLMRLYPLGRLLADRYDYMLKLQTHAFSFSGQNLIREWKEKNTKENIRHKPDKWLRENYFDHHLCHAAAAAYSSPFEEAVVAVIDGYGQMTSTAFYHFSNGTLRHLKAIKKSKNSLGFFYSFLCAACGFNPDLGEEWKVMGLAPYGSLIPELYDKLATLIPMKNGRFVNPGIFFDIALYDRLISRAVSGGSHPYQTKDIACTGQKVFEDKMMECLGYVHGMGRSGNLVLAGGCALNSSCNGKIAERTPFRNVYVYNAPGDDGTAVGAAILSYLTVNPLASLNRKSLLSPYKGSHIEKNALHKAVKNTPFCYFLGEKKYRVAAQLLSEGNIIGWVQGRAEFGPRALGNRSILADPRREDIKDIINEKLKYRESFRPFAPSILEEYGAEIFENYQTSYYMDKTLTIKACYRQKIPGVTHVNGTGRLQSVNKELNPPFYSLLSEFRKLTGIPVLLNTSFNLSGKPIVHNIDDIMASLYTSGLSAVVVEDYLFTKVPFREEA